MRIAASHDAAVHRQREIVDHLHARQPAVLPDKAGRIELDAADPHRLELHLGLPFVDLGERLGGQRRQEPLGPELEQLACASRNSAEPKPSEHSEAMISVPPGSRMSSGVTMPLTV